MSIKDDLNDELKDAMRAHDQNRTDVVRQIKTEVTRALKAPGFAGEADDDLYRATISSYAKKMVKALAEYERLGDRGAETAAKLRFEVEYLSRWLPKGSVGRGSSGVRGCRGAGARGDRPRDHGAGDGLPHEAAFRPGWNDGEPAGADTSELGDQGLEHAKRLERVAQHVFRFLVAQELLDKGGVHTPEVGRVLQVVAEHQFGEARGRAVLPALHAAA